MLVTFYLTPQPADSTGSLGKVGQKQLKLRQFNKPEHPPSGDANRQEEQLSFA